MGRKVWIDDVRPAPTDDYKWIKSVHEAKIYICQMTRFDDADNMYHNIELLDLDHDAGKYAWNGGDYIKLLDWMEEKGINDIPIRIHSMNPVGRANMLRICKRNGWEVIN